MIFFKRSKDIDFSNLENVKKQKDFFYNLKKFFSIQKLAQEELILIMWIK